MNQTNNRGRRSGIGELLGVVGVLIYLSEEENYAPSKGQERVDNEPPKYNPV